MEQVLIEQLPVHTTPGDSTEEQVAAVQPTTPQFDEQKYFAVQQVPVVVQTVPNTPILSEQYESHSENHAFQHQSSQTMSQQSSTSWASGTVIEEKTVDATVAPLSPPPVPTAQEDNTHVKIHEETKETPEVTPVVHHVFVDKVITVVSEEPKVEEHIVHVVTDVSQV